MRELPFIDGRSSAGEGLISTFSTFASAPARIQFVKRPEG
jgi:hypothetical protein